jgi:hypothetical protein
MRQLLALGMVLISLGLGSELSYGQRDPQRPLSAGVSREI